MRKDNVHWWFTSSVMSIFVLMETVERKGPMLMQYLQLQLAVTYLRQSLFENSSDLITVHCSFIIVESS